MIQSKNPKDDWIRWAKKYGRILNPNSKIVLLKFFKKNTIKIKINIKKIKIQLDEHPKYSIRWTLKFLKIKIQLDERPKYSINEHKKQKITSA